MPRVGGRRECIFPAETPTFGSSGNTDIFGIETLLESHVFLLAVFRALI